METIDIDVEFEFDVSSGPLKGKTIEMTKLNFKSVQSIDMTV